MPSDLTKALRASVEFDTTKAHREICDLAANGGRERWRMSIPVRSDDSDMTLQEPLDHLARLAPILEKLIAVVESAERAAKFGFVQTETNGILRNTAIELRDALADLRAAVGLEVGK